MTQEEKAKAYDEVLNKLRRFIAQGVDPLITRADVQDFFPELKENKDERIRKEIISALKFANVKGVYDEHIAWLEKQESVEEIVERCKTSWYNEGKIAGMAEGLTDDEKYQQGWHDALEKQNEQKPADKIEPRFKNGQWIVWQNKCYKVNYNGCGYELIDQNGLSTSLEYGTLDASAHLWDITKDAKDGDVLVYKDEISLYKHDINNCTNQETTFGGFVFHCCYDGKRFIMDSLYSLTEQDKMDIQPATKAQRVLLFKKMHEAGYEWDADKLELYKKPKFKVGDFIVNDYCFGKVIEITNDAYLLDTDQGIPFSYEHNAHLWTIQDAKDGDVLAYVTDEEDLWIMIYWSLYEPYEGHVHYHALLVNDNFSDKGTCCICIDNLKPATKEQRDLLFAKMNEAGYEWDAEKKKLSRRVIDEGKSEMDYCFTKMMNGEKGKSNLE